MPDAAQRGGREKRRVALTSLVAAVLLTGTKLAIGLWTNSLGILSEAAHSGLDLMAAGMTLYAVRASAQPADSCHTYGHGKIENLSALFETLLLLVTCVWIIYEAGERLLGHGGLVEVNVWAFATILLSIGIDISRSRALMRVAKKYKSQALEADALHFSTDVWSSTVVLGGLAAVYVSSKFNVPWLANADTLAALTVAGIVIWVSIALGKRAVDDLLDAVPRDLTEQIGAAAQVEGVLQVKTVRVRRSGPDYFADLTLVIGREVGVEQAHEIADRAEAAVHKVVPHADVVVHVEPGKNGTMEDEVTTVRVLAGRQGLGAHGLRVCELGGDRVLELHLEAPNGLTLDEAHRRATAFERSVKSEIKGISRIVSHIEPAGYRLSSAQAAPEDVERVRDALRRLPSGHGLVGAPHAVDVRRVNGELSLTFHCSFEPETPVDKAHMLTRKLESYLRERVPGLSRVVIHAEPANGALSSPGQRVG